MAKLCIARTSVTLDVPMGENLLRALQAAKHPISTSCGGRATCGLCRLSVVAGADALTPISEAEIEHLGSVARVIGTRLACQARVVGEGVIVVDVPEVDDVALRKGLKAERAHRERSGAEASASSAATSKAAPKVIAQSPPAKIEWRPRKLPGGGGQGQKLPIENALEIRVVTPASPALPRACEVYGKTGVAAA